MASIERLILNEIDLNTELCVLNEIETILGRILGLRETLFILLSGDLVLE